MRTVNRQCSSGLQAIADVAAAIKAGFYTVGLAGGVETMSSNPMAWEVSSAAESTAAPACVLCAVSAAHMQRPGLTLDALRLHLRQQVIPQTQLQCVSRRMYSLAGTVACCRAASTRGSVSTPRRRAACCPWASPARTWPPPTTSAAAHRCAPADLLMCAFAHMLPNHASVEQAMLHMPGRCLLTWLTSWKCSLLR